MQVCHPMKHWVPRYSGPNRSGICKCGHAWDEHHLGVVLNNKYYEQTQEPYLPEECEYFGSNEIGGLNRDGSPHCDHYQDTMEQP